MNITATHINYFHLCKRKTWLFGNGIQMEHTSDTVYEGKMLHENSYPQRAEKYTEIEIGGSKIDFYDAKNKVVHEIKKSASMEEAHVWQVKYYLWLLEQSGVEGVSGVLEYPKLRETMKVELLNVDRKRMPELIAEIEALVEQETVPPTIAKRFCEKCSYFEFCWAGE